MDRTSFKRGIVRYYKSVPLLAGVPVFASNILDGASASFAWLDEIFAGRWMMISIIAGVALAAAIVWQMLRRKNSGHPGWVEYSVKAEDNISSLAGRYRIDWNELIIVNRIKAPYVLEPGQAILMPPEAAAEGQTGSPEEKAESFISADPEKADAPKHPDHSDLFDPWNALMMGLSLAVVVALAWPISSWLLVWRNQAHHPKKISIANLEIPPRGVPQVSVESTGSDTASGSAVQETSSENNEITSGPAQDIKKLKIVVLNGGAPAGVAGKIAMLIAGKGYSEPTAKNAASDQHSGQAVYYSGSSQAEAAKVRDILKVQYPDILLKAAVSAEEKSADIVVMLGG